MVAELMVSLLTISLHYVLPSMNVYSEEQNMQVKSVEEFGNEKIYTTYYAVVQQVTANYN